MIYLVSNQSFLHDSNMYKIISLEAAIEMLQPLNEIGLDTETEGLDVYTKRLLSIQLGNFDFQILFDISSFNNIIPPKLAAFLHKSNKLFILQNAKFDLKFFFKQGIIILRVFDTMLAEYILTNGLQYSGRDLASLGMKYCNVYLDKSIRGQIKNLGLTEKVIQYSADDVKYLSIIKEKQLEKAKELDLLNAISLDNSFVIVLAYVEFCGIKLNLEKWLKRTHVSKLKVLELKIELNNILLKEGKFKYFTGMQDMFTGEYECILNWDSPKQVLNLFKEYGINVVIKDKGINKETIDSKVLSPQKINFLY